MSASMSVLSSSSSSSVFNQSSASSASSSSTRTELFTGRRSQQQPSQSDMYANIMRLLDQNGQRLKDLTGSVEGQTKEIEAQNSKIAANETMVGRLGEEYARVNENNQGTRRAIDVQHQENEQVRQDLQDVRVANSNLKTAIALESLAIGGVALANPAVRAAASSVGSYAIAGAKKVVEFVKS